MNRHKTWRRVGLLLALIIGISLIANLGLPVETQAAGKAERVGAVQTSSSIAGPVNISGTKLVDGSSKPFFLTGANYVGHTDRAWEMWENDRFDAGLISQDFELAAQAGINTIRIFVMKPLRDDINANNFGKLDKVLEIAASKGLLVLLTFNDYDEPDLAKEAALNKKIAARYASNNTLLGYDLKNEPQFLDVVAATYPAGTNVPLQREEFIQAYGERMSQSAVDAWRQTAEGKRVVPARLSQRAGYVYANAYKLYVEFLNDSGAWVQSHGGKNTLDYIDSAEANKWRVYLDAMSGTVASYIEVRASAVRQADAKVPITVGWSNAILAKMRGNDRLGFVSLHRFVAEGYSGLITTMNMMNNLQATFAGRPVVLEEFGYSNAKDNGQLIPTSLTANYEAALWLFLSDKGFAGGMKWMLVNFPSGFNKVQNNYGLLDDSTQPKPSYHALRAISSYVKLNNQAPQGDLSNITAAGTDISYSYSGPNGVFGNSTNGQAGPVRYSQATTSPFAAYWPTTGSGEIWVLATQPANVVLDLGQIYPQRNTAAPVKITGEGLAEQNLTANGNNVSFQVEAGRLYTVRVSTRPPAFNRAGPIGGSRYFNETGHNLGGAFRTYWEQNGGLAIYGYPLCEEFSEGGFTVQYFERARFEYHPENKGTRYEVLLGLLGKTVTAGREGEASFSRIPAFQSNPNSTYFDATGHSLSFGFKIYWERNGGLAQFGYPTSEEFSELNPADGKIYTVQYFERARFEYHPEHKNTPYETELGLLGWQIVKARGWL